MNGVRSQLATKFTSLDVYFDTPFLLPALGYGEDGLHAQCIDLLELLRELGAGVKCFHHTREEVVGVLEAIAASKRTGGKGPGDGSYYSTSKRFSLSEIEEMITEIDTTLGALGIDVVDTPAWSAKPDEATLEEELKHAIDYQRDRAREKDVQSLAAIARLRKLRRMDKFETARAIFVTRNLALVRVSAEFFADIEKGARSRSVCP
jgi:hypothetical protein